MLTLRVLSLFRWERTSASVVPLGYATRGCGRPADYRAVQHRARLPGDLVPTSEQDHGRDGTDAKAASDPLLGLCVQLAQPHCGLQLLCGSGKGGCHLSTWAAPAGPKVHQQGNARAARMGFEVRGRERDGRAHEQRVVALAALAVGGQLGARHAVGGRACGTGYDQSVSCIRHFILLRLSRHMQNAGPRWRLRLPESTLLPRLKCVGCSDRESSSRQPRWGKSRSISSRRVPGGTRRGQCPRQNPLISAVGGYGGHIERVLRRGARGAAAAVAVAAGTACPAPILLINV